MKCSNEECDFEVGGRGSHSAMARHKLLAHGEGATCNMVQVCGVDECEYTAKRNVDMVRHRQSVHEIGVKWLTCSAAGCGKSFKQPSTLREHRQNVHDIGVNWKQCDMCDYRSKQSSGMKRHQMSVHHVK